MKKLLLILITALMFISCKKTIEEPKSALLSPVSTFKYKIDGTLVEMNGSLAENSKEGSVIRKHNVFNTSASYYSLAATKDYIHTGDGKMPMHFVFSTNNLSTGTYSIANGKLNHVNIIKFGGTKAHWIAPFDNDGSIFIVNVTKVTNGFADGNFSGNFSSQRIGGSAIQITEGEFKNVKILE